MGVADDLRAQLAASGAPAAHVEHVAEIGSTNDRLKEIARTGAPEWSVVLADRQSAGRGRQGSIWVSGTGDLCLSVLLRPRIGPEDAAVLPLAAGLAVAEALEAFAAEPRLKWPNDVLLGGKKVAGILAEGVATGAGLEAVVVGIGVNLVLDTASLAGTLPARVTSLLAATGKRVAPGPLAAAVLARLTVWYHALERQGASPVVSQWRARAVSWWGRRVEVVSGGETITGIARDVDARGALLLETEQGLVPILSGEARMLRPR
jgi:BirA family biotin operon repressor/biotin-[acetyl-CoA-carboxylase] ligase